MGPNACQLSVNCEAIFVSSSKQYDFSPLSVVSYKPKGSKSQIQGLSVTLVCQLSVKNKDDCQSPH